MTDSGSLSAPHQSAREFGARCSDTLRNLSADVSEMYQSIRDWLVLRRVGTSAGWQKCLLSNTVQYQET